MCLARTLHGHFAGERIAGRVRPVVMAHYMPWYEAQPYHAKWGWHWTMNHFRPGNLLDGRQEAASNYRPLVGLYDSSDPDAIECQIQLMKMCGIDGVFLDWYGLEDLNDYRAIHQNCQLVINTIKKAHMRFAIVFEDQTVQNLILAKKYLASEAVSRSQSMMRWLETNWFSDPNYLKLSAQPVFLVFGPQYFKDGDFASIFRSLKSQPAVFTLSNRKQSALGAFNWPVPQRGEAESWREVDRFIKDSKSWKQSVSVAYPRFDDIYQQAGVQNSYGKIFDNHGETFRKTLQQGLNSSSKILQIATWNDWGEGTQIEPSVEFGFRDLELTQHLLHPLKSDGSPYSPQDLRMPVTLYQMRKRTHGSLEVTHQLAVASDFLLAGDTQSAQRMIAHARLPLLSQPRQ